MNSSFDTTSFFLQMTSYELAMNPEIQKKLQEAIDEVASTLNGQPITYEALHKIKYLDMVVSESLRKWSPAPQIDRSCSKDYVMDLGSGKTIKIKKNQIVNLPIFHIHHDPNYFPNPERFDPNRFSDENKDEIQPGTYFPFGSGPRTCIGSRYALMEAKLLLFHFLSRFSIEKCNETPEKVRYAAKINFRIEEKVYLKFKLRK
jgi:cytochrome P450 family 9